MTGEPNSTKRSKAQLEVAQIRLANTKAELETVTAQVFELKKKWREHKCEAAPDRHEAATQHIDRLLAEYPQPRSRSTVNFIAAIFALLLLIAAVSLVGYRIYNLDIADRKKSERIEQLERLDLDERVKQLEKTLEEMQQPATGEVTQ